MGSPSRTRLQSRRFFSCWGPWLPWLLQPQKQNQKLQPMLTPGTDMDTADTDGAATTGLMATMATMERGLLMLNLLPNLPLQLTLTLTPTLGTVIMAMATVAMDGAATTGLTAITVTGAKQAIRKVDSSSDCDFPSTLASISRACA